MTLIDVDPNFNPDILDGRFDMPVIGGDVVPANTGEKAEIVRERDVKIGGQVTHTVLHIPKPTPHEQVPVHGPEAPTGGQS